jgi:hypothetical protein
MNGFYLLHVFLAAWIRNSFPGFDEIPLFKEAVPKEEAENRIPFAHNRFSAWKKRHKGVRRIVIEKNSR